jgi:hypothetical protein
MKNTRPMTSSADVAFRQKIVNSQRHVRADGGEVDEAFCALAFDHPALAGCDLERGLQRRQARQHGFSAVGDVFWRGSGLRAKRNQFVDRLLALVEHDELMFGLDQAAGHGKAHLAQADESDVHDGLSLESILAVIARSEATKQSSSRRVQSWIASLRSQ